MSVTFLSPEAALIGLSVGIPLLALALAEARARVARSVLRLPPPLARGSGYVIAIAAFALLVAVGAAQPVLEREKTRSVRKDAEAYVVIDTSKSMQAASGPEAEIRLDRAQRLARELRTGLPDVAVGVASLTDRVLLHLFPTTSEASFELIVERSLGIERPPPAQRGDRLRSTFDALGALPKDGYFRGGSRHRVLAIFTDAESRPFNRAYLRDAFRESRIETVIVRVGSDGERVYERGVPDPRYRPPPTAEEDARSLAAAVGGQAFEEDELGKAIKAVRSSAGEGGPRAETREVDPTPLASYAFAFAFLPLGFLLWRRNLR